MRADNPPSLLQATDITVCYGKQTAIKSVDLELAAGDTLGLLGLNGAGKSSLLRVLAGVAAPKSGTLVVNGHDMHSDPLAARRCIGYAPDKPPLYPQFTVREFLRFAAGLRNIKKQEIGRATDDAIDKCGLNAVAGRIIGNLSHGYQQRINIAQALIHNPGVLILDEPANGLDPAQLQEIRTLIQQIHQHHATVFSSHLLGEVQQVCNRVAVINDGSKMLDIPLSELNDDTHPTFEVVLQESAAQTDLQALPGVVSVCSVDALHWLVTTDAGSASATIERLGEALMARGMQFLEVNPVRNQLEKLFSQLKGNGANVALGDTP